VTWTFKIATGEFIDPQGHVLSSTAYSGHPPHVNDPTAFKIPMQGPLPPGVYGIGNPRNPPDHLGPVAMPLHPTASTFLYGRSGFFIHGDNAQMNHTASDGCIILGRAIRDMIAESADRQLTVTI
jgi:hypothetical protein